MIINKQLDNCVNNVQYFFNIKYLPGTEASRPSSSSKFILTAKIFIRHAKHNKRNNLFKMGKYDSFFSIALILCTYIYEGHILTQYDKHCN